MSYQDGDNPAAVVSYRQALKLEPRHAFAKNNLAVLLSLDAKTQQEAVDMATDLVTESPDNPIYIDTLASALSLMGNHEEAVKHAKRAVELRPNGTVFKKNLLTILERAGKSQEAEELRQDLNTGDSQSSTTWKKISVASAWSCLGVAA